MSCSPLFFVLNWNSQNMYRQILSFLEQFVFEILLGECCYTINPSNESFASSFANICYTTLPLKNLGNSSDTACNDVQFKRSPKCLSHFVSLFSVKLYCLIEKHSNLTFKYRLLHSQTCLMVLFPTNFFFFFTNFVHLNLANLLYTYLFIYC
jgi:hypothetical protein